MFFYCILHRRVVTFVVMKLSSDAEKQSIVGKKIVRIEINESDDQLCMTDDKGTTHWICAVGECCSRSWFEYLTPPDLPFVIKEELVIPNDFMLKHEKLISDRNTDMKIYALNFKTNKGDFPIEIRNESNGYYGGNLEYSTGLPVNQYKVNCKIGKMRNVCRI